MSSQLSFITLVTSSSSASSFWWNPPQVGTVSLTTVCESLSWVQLFATLRTHGASIHGILQARILEWVAIPLSRGSSQLRDWTWVPYIAGRFFTIWATRETLLSNCTNKKKGNQGQSLVSRGHWPDLTLSNLLHFCNTNCRTCFQKTASRTSFCALSF